jgi:Cytidine and deoxycytidylate deaminase zinc-binding region
MDSTHEQYFDHAAQEAQKALCKRARCGTVIVKDGNIIGRGSNGPAPGDSLRCEDRYVLTRKSKYDKTCCVHAEWRAIVDACKRAAATIEGATLYFMRIDENDNFTDAGEPFCTVCSRLALESGVATFGLWNQSGAVLYDTRTYNQKSYDYYGR